MNTQICTYVDTIELDRIIQKIIHEGDEQIISVVRTSNFGPFGKTDCADYIILYTQIN